MAENHAESVEIFDGGEWGVGAGIGQLKIGNTYLVLVREGRKVLPLMVGQHSGSLKTLWAHFSGTEAYNEDESPVVILTKFLRYRETRS